MKEFKKNTVQEQINELQQKIKKTITDIPIKTGSYGRQVWDESSSEYNLWLTYMDELEELQTKCSHEVATEYICRDSYLNGLVFCNECGKELVQLCRKSPSLQCEFELDENGVHKDICIHCGRDYDESCFSKNASTGSCLDNFSFTIIR